MTEHWTFKWAGWYDDSPRHYTYNTETGIITNEDNGRSVQAGTGLDFRAWLLKAGAIQIEQEQPTPDPSRKGRGSNVLTPLCS